VTLTQNERAAAPDPSEILRAIGDAAYEWHLGSDAIFWTDNAAAVLGVPLDAIATGRAWAKLVDTEGGHGRFDVVTRSGQRDEGEGIPYRVEYAFTAGAEKAWIEDCGRWFAGTDGLPARAIGVVRVISERRQREQELTRLAHYDQLTGEMNRARLVGLLGETLDEAVRFRASCGFLLIAIDNLGRRNESYGFTLADEAIKQVAKRLRSRMRGIDHLGVFSGNKFGVILKNCTPEELSVAADRLLAAVRDETLATSAGPLAVTITIGGVTAPRHARSVEDIISRSQDSLDLARTRRHGSFCAYQPSVERDSMRRETARATDEIVAALNERRVALAFEPVVATATRAPAFYECLMRVNRADGRIIHAQDVVPLAERVGLVRMLDHRVLELVINELAAAPALCASVNVSSVSTTDPNWWAGLGGMLRANAGTAERLIIEITETGAIQDIDDARGFVARVKDLGCRIAIDDFGAGHTSFRNLRRLGVDIVKIDGSFVQKMLKSDDDSAFVQTLIDLARRLGLKTVAEWVQDEDTARLLAGWGCDFLQGQLIGLASSARPWLPQSGVCSTASA
jgi:diguanylate cyclase (GGDEF)-like protein